jgi:exonuclease III
MVLKLATLNLCLGLPNKKLIVKELIIQEKIDVLCMQETEIPYNLDHQLLSFPGFCLESETNSLMSRVGIYVNSKIKYVRRNELEGKDSHIVIIDVIGHEKLRIINIYRTFCPKNGMTPKEFFIYQLGIIKNAMNNCSILLGDFNLDIRKKGLASYPFKSYFDEMDLALLELNLTQIVDFSTWSRTVSGQQR